MIPRSDAMTLQRGCSRWLCAGVHHVLIVTHAIGETANAESFHQRCMF